jgi:hypothetical protein
MGRTKKKYMRGGSPPKVKPLGSSPDTSGSFKRGSSGRSSFKNRFTGPQNTQTSGVVKSYVPPVNIGKVTWNQQSMSTTRFMNSEIITPGNINYSPPKPVTPSLQPGPSRPRGTQPNTKPQQKSSLWEKVRSALVKNKPVVNPQPVINLKNPVPNITSTSSIHHY